MGGGGGYGQQGPPMVRSSFDSRHQLTEADAG